MATLIDTSVWIDFTRSRSPRTLKEFVAPHVNDPEACLAEPIIFEVLRSATDDEALRMTRQFETRPCSQVRSICGVAASNSDVPVGGWA